MGGRCLRLEGESSAKGVWCVLYVFTAVGDGWAVNRTAESNWESYTLCANLVAICVVRYRRCGLRDEL